MGKKILIVEDEKINAMYLKRLLESLDFIVLEAVNNGMTAVERALQEHPDLILMDIMLEGDMDGIDASIEIHRSMDVPIIFISAFSDDSLVERAKEASPYGYIIKPFEKRNLSTVLTLALHRHHLEKSLTESFNKLKTILDGALHAIAKAVEVRDPYTAGHQRRVGDLSKAIAHKMGLGEDMVETSYVAGTIHDIGKISVPAEILTKPTRLNEAEYMLIKGHPLTGFEILKEIELPTIISQVVFQHHERFDGSGYPRGLGGADIFLESRIVAVSDVVESMSSHRPYRPALGLESALEEITSGSGIIYDRNVVDACVALLHEQEFSFAWTL
jgi:putative nucleotidyltransferase with HDIG domain